MQGNFEYIILLANSGVVFKEFGRAVEVQMVKSRDGQFEISEALGARR
jgi:hypothetical protein